VSSNETVARWGYGWRTRSGAAFFDEQLCSLIGILSLFNRKPIFTTDWCKPAGGNTTVLNRAARYVVALASTRSRFVGYDWWMYQLVTPAGDIVHSSPDSLVRYRRHTENLVGSNTSWKARFSGSGGCSAANSRNGTRQSPPASKRTATHSHPTQPISWTSSLMPRRLTLSTAWPGCANPASTGRLCGVRWAVGIARAAAHVVVKRAFDLVLAIPLACSPARSCSPQWPVSG
jgi:hypothetical protein